MLGSVGQGFNKFKSWVGKQVVQGDDFGTARNDKRRDYAVLGAATGAVAGATIGTITGFQSQSQISVDESTVNLPIKHPRMTGFSHHTSPRYRTDYHTDSNGDTYTTRELTGYYHSYSPNITNRVVGTFDQPTFELSNTWEPLRGGIIGAIGGGALGLAAGIGLAVLQESLEGSKAPAEVELPPQKTKEIVNRSGTAVIAGTAIGAGVGAFLGAQAGAAELGAGEVHTRSWMAPVMRNETLGHIPHNHTQTVWFGTGWPNSGRTSGNKPVIRPVPTYTRAGQPQMAETTKTFETNRYGTVFGGITGGIIGAGVGLAAGVAVGVGGKLMAELQAEKAANNESEKAA